MKYSFHMILVLMHWWTTEKKVKYFDNFRCVFLIRNDQNVSHSEPHNKYTRSLANSQIQRAWNSIVWMVSFSPPPIFSHLANAFLPFSTLVIEMQDRLKYSNCTIWGGEKGLRAPNRSRLYISKVFFGLVGERAKSFSYTRKQEVSDFLPEMMFVEAKVGHISDDPDHWSWCNDHSSIDWLSADRLLHRTTPPGTKKWWLETDNAGTFLI